MSNVANISHSSPRGSEKKISASPQDKEIQQLIKSKAKMQEEIQKINTNSELDSKVKMERLKTITANIQQIDSRISAIKLEQLQNKKDKDVKDVRSSDPAQSQSKTEFDPHLTAIIEKSATYEHLEKMVSQKTKMEGSIKTLEGGVNFDRIVLDGGSSNDNGKSMMLENAELTVFKKKGETVQEIHSHILSMDKKIHDLVSDINEADKSKASPNKYGSNIADKGENVDGSVVKDSTATAESSSPESTDHSQSASTLDIRI